MSSDRGETWARMARTAERTGLEAVAAATWRPSSSDLTASQDTAVVLERLTDPAEGGGYDVVGKRGQGGMGVVLQARQRSLARHVALKRLRVDKSSSRAQFVSEAQICGRLEHPHVLPVHTLDNDQDGLCLAMKLVTGASWANVLRDRPEARAEHLQILRAVCLAMEYAHARGILHRDLKPANVMVGDYGQIYVMDWGVAVAFDDDAADDSAILRLFDMPGPVGTPRYMAPELAQGDPHAQGPATDVYLLGGCLKELLDGKPPNDGSSGAGDRERAKRGPCLLFAAAAPAGLGAICQRALAPDPAARFESVLAFRRALDDYLEHREAHALAGEGREALERLELAEDDREVHRLHAEATFAFDAALERWSGLTAAAEGRARAHEVLLDHALRHEDLPLAERLRPEVDESRHGAIDALAARVAEREEELERLRVRAEGQNWETVARPLGNTFVVGGILGGANALLSQHLLRSKEPEAFIYFGGSWLMLTILIGLVAIHFLRRGLPKRVAPRVLGTWAAVASGNLLLGVVDVAAGREPFSTSYASALMIGIGFASMAMQTRFWLLGPAVLWAGGAIALSPTSSPPQQAMVFGGLWVATMVGVGIALRAGATLEPKADGRDEPRAGQTSPP